jgi:predicted Zn-dependent protease
MKHLGLLLLLSSLLLGACVKNPVTGEHDLALITEAEEIEQGRSYHPEIIKAYGVYDDPELQKYVDRIGQKLAAKSHRAHLEFHFTVLDSPDINAFALPGGYVYITRGIMAYLDSEAELAGVLGHEIGHVTARHSVRQQTGQFTSNLLGVLISATTGQESLGNLSQQLSTGLIRGYGRDHELEADRLGAEYLYQIDYDPDYMLEVIGVLKDQEVYEKRLAEKENREANIYHGVYSTHPQNDDRLKTVVRAAKKLPNKKYRDANQAAYYERIDGLVWGPGLAQGVVVDNRFLHPDLAIALDLPKGWKVDNNPQFLEVREPQSSALMQISVVPREKNESAGAALKRLTGDKRLEFEDTDNGATASVSVNTGDGQSQPARISAIPLGKKSMLTLVGTADKKHFKLVEKELLQTAASLQNLDAAQVAAIKVPRLRIIPRGSQSFESLAQQSALGYDAVDILRLLNRSYPSGKIDKLSTLKTVTIDDD